MTSTHVIWFRQDLRITDNLALSAACADPHARILALFIATPQQWQQHSMAPRQAGMLSAALASLQKDLEQRGIPLVMHQCTDFSAASRWVIEFCREQQVTHFFYNKQYEINEIQRDQQVETGLAQAGIESHAFHDSVLFAPGTVLTGSGEMYRVFTPYRQAVIRQMLSSPPVSVPAPAARRYTRSDLKSSSVVLEYPMESQSLFATTEWQALETLRHFCRESVSHYHQRRDFPALPGTSTLSAYLTLGLLSPRQCVNRLRLEHPDFLQNPESGAFCWFSELVWREFYRHLIAAYPHLCRYQPFVGWTKWVRWREDPQGLQAWQSGLTGFPIVDAAMRQLKQTGWMHNRLRMITASFLVKDLLIDWRLGENYFMSQLTDGDLAANNGGWQWAASTGTDAAPYFRIFNPTTQGKRFDPEGVFIRQWVPELQKVPQEGIHEPHRWATKRGVTLEYPAPILDHAAARLRTLAAFEAARQHKSISVLPEVE